MTGVENSSMAGRPLRRFRESLRANPLAVDVRISPGRLTGLAEQYKHFRSVSSLLSPIKRKSVVERFADSKHDFRLVIHHGGYFPYVDDSRVFAQPGKITLLILPSALAMEEATDPDDPEGSLDRPRSLSETTKSDRTSVLTAWTYMHRVGDSTLVLDGLRHLLLGLIPKWDKGRASPERAVSFFWEVRKAKGYLPRRPNKKLIEAAGRIASIRSAAVEDLVASGMAEKKATSVLDEFIKNNTNSKMARDGYSGSPAQSLADWFAICELTNNPVLLPSNAKKSSVREALDTFAAGMNTHFPSFYNALMSGMVGGVVVI